MRKGICVCARVLRVQHIQCLRKVFRPLDFIHILLRYSLILKLIKLYFFPYQSTHNTPQCQSKNRFIDIFCKCITNIKRKISHFRKYSDPLLKTGERCCTAMLRSLQRCSIGFKSGLWLGHSRTFRDLSQSHSCVVLAVCLGLLSCWKVNHRPSLRS